MDPEARLSGGIKSKYCFWRSIIQPVIGGRIMKQTRRDCFFRIENAVSCHRMAFIICWNDWEKNDEQLHYHIYRKTL